MLKNFDEFVSLWKSETSDIKIREPDFLFLVVYPDNLEWSFAIEKQTQTTTMNVSGGWTGSAVGHDVQFCYRSEVNDFLKNCNHTHAMIVSVGMVFDMVTSETSTEGKWRDNFKVKPNQVTAITDFYDFVESEEYCKAHIMAKPDDPAYLHHQHINLNVDMWKTIGCPPLDERWEDFERGVENFHDDYTPYWIKPNNRPMILNFDRNERRRKSFSYYRPLHEESWSNLENVDRGDYYFSRFMTRMEPAFYLFNTESFQKVPKEKFDIIFSPTAGYNTELLIEELKFSGEVIFYDYTQENIDVKKTIVNMGMSLDELYSYTDIQRNRNINMVDNSKNSGAADRIVSMGSHEKLRQLQEKMRDEQEVEYWLMDIINPDYNKLSEKVKGKNVFFDTSNIFGYHMSHAYNTLDELVNSYNKLHETLIESSNMCWFQGTKPTKQMVRKWIS